VLRELWVLLGKVLGIRVQRLGFRTLIWYFNTWNLVIPGGLELGEFLNSFFKELPLTPRFPGRWTQVKVYLQELKLWIFYLVVQGFTKFHKTTIKFWWV